MTTARHDQRLPRQLRPISVERPSYGAAAGRVLIRAGRTTVLCTASVDEAIPPWKKNDPVPSGWVTAEYSMLPGSTSPRKSRERGGKVDGRSTEIQRLIGRSLRAVINFEALGPRTIAIDCDVLEADGGTRTLSITGGFLALVDAVHSLVPLGVDPHKVITQSIAAVSVGIVDGQPGEHADGRAPQGCEASARSAGRVGGAAAGGFAGGAAGERMDDAAGLGG